MEIEILKFLYEFYERGDCPHKSIFDILDTLPTKWNDQKSINDLKERIARLINGELIEGDWSDDYFKSWGQIDTGKTFLYRDKFPLSARLTDKGASHVERRLEKERQKKIDGSVLFTNRLTWWNIGATILFGIIVTTIQIKSCSREKLRVRQEVQKSYSDSLKLLRQLEHDSLYENKALDILVGIRDSLSNLRHGAMGK